MKHTGLVKNLLQFASGLWYDAYLRNANNILALLEKDTDAKVLDVGCGDGKTTLRYKYFIGCRRIFGIDAQKGRVDAANRRGVNAIVGRIDTKWPFSSESFDVIISNQVIEHMADIDHFISETYRVLKPGGYAVVSTENLASWHSIAALVLGYQDFSHHILMKKHIGNPFSIHFGEETATWSKKDNSGVDDSAFPHIKIMTYRSLIEAYATYDFVFEKGRGSGYYPLFPPVSTLLSRIDPSHCHFISIKVRK
jgi:ubiquinone/menaquinone biosynthesis C-methylase UbiE